MSRRLNYDSADHESARIVAIVVIFFVSLIGFLFPLLLPAVKKEALKKDHWLLLKSLSSGVILGVAFLHLLPECSEVLAEKMEYPIAYLLVLIGFFATMFFEHLALEFIQLVDSSKYFKAQITEEVHCDGSKCNVDIEANKTYDRENGSPSIELEKVGEEIIIACNSSNNNRMICTSETKDEPEENFEMNFAHHHVHTHIENKDFNHSKTLVKVLIMESAIAIHSIIIGFDLGVLSKSEVRIIQILTIAFCFHQAFEGLSLGTSVAQTKLGERYKLLLAFLFASTLPIGIVIGIGVDSRTSEYGETTAAVASAVAAGSLLHSGFIEMIAEDFGDSYLIDKFKLKLKMFFALVVGISIMAILAIWA